VKKKKIGIWGLGVTGKAAVNYFHSLEYQLQVMDTKVLSNEDQEFLKNREIAYIKEKEQDSFFVCNEFLFSSPGIDIKKYYTTYQQKWLNELDLFYQNFKKPIIAITGSIGKTSITHLLSQCFAYYSLNVATGGNIGIPPLALLQQQKLIDTALLEVSSFQLAYCKQFAPDIAVWTNFYPNHLDWHSSIENYFTAKYSIVAQQQPNQKALLPFNLLRQIKKHGLHSQHISFFSDYRPTASQLKLLQPRDCLYFIDPPHIIKYKNGIYKSLIAIDKFPPITFKQNWLIICSILDIIGLPLTSLPLFAQQATLPEHRLEKVACFNGIDFYNDSKSTTPASTYAAVQALSLNPIFLLLGGLSKGINRAPFIKSLKNYVLFIYCFGSEAIELNNFCKKYGIPAAAYPTLDYAFTDAIKHTKSGYVLLFSPAGSSFDLFSNYQERGDYFKKLVNSYIINQNKKMR